MKWPAALLRSGLINFAAVALCAAVGIFVWAFLQNPLNLYKTGWETAYPEGLINFSFVVGAVFASWSCACLAASKLMYIYTPFVLALLVYANSCPGYALSFSVAVVWLLLAYLLHKGIVGGQAAAVDSSANAIAKRPLNAK
ncbi:MAG: hypothetical protein ACI38Q_08980 [Candidatus Bruticola sp.]